MKINYQIACRITLWLSELQSTRLRQNQSFKISGPTGDPRIALRSVAAVGYTAKTCHGNI